MSYHLQTRKKNRSPLKKIVFVVVICAILLFFARNLIGNVLLSISGGISSAVSYIFPKGLRSDNTILEENTRLREDVIRLTSLNADHDVLLQENTNLKFLLGRSAGASSTKQILGTVIESPSKTPFDVFLLDVGKEMNVKNEDKVLVGSLVIGKIIEVGNGYSKALLYSAPGNVFEGRVGVLDIKIEAKGLGGGQFESLVPLGAKIEVGDSLILPSISPKVFGIIETIEELNTEGFKRLLFTLPINPNQIMHVLIAE